MEWCGEPAYGVNQEDDQFFFFFIPEGAGCCQALFSPSSTWFWAAPSKGAGSRRSVRRRVSGADERSLRRPCSVQTCRESKTSRRCAVVGGAFSRLM